MRDLTQLGFKPYSGRPFPPFSDETLHAFEAAFGVKLPDDYVQLLRSYNGGTLAMSTYDDPTMGECELNDFYGLGSREGDDKAAAAGKWELGNLWGETDDGSTKDVAACWDLVPLPSAYVVDRETAIVAAKEFYEAGRLSPRLKWEKS